jgi:hypothetical protein
MHMLLKKTLYAGIAAMMFDACISQGTILDKTEILQKSYKQWTEEECRIVMKDYASTNILNSSASLSIVVIPCTPNFLLSYNCLTWKKHLCSFEEFNENTDRQARNCFGGSFDNRTGRFINGKGEYIHGITQIDSLVFVFDIQNTNEVKKLIQWGLYPLVGSSLYLDIFPNVTDMENKISFRAGNVVLAKPVYVRSGNASLLTKEEEYTAMFHIDEKFKRYIREHDSVDLYFSLGNHSVVIPVRFSI